jgi:hypothetical protein
MKYNKKIVKSLIFICIIAFLCIPNSVASFAIQNFFNIAATVEAKSNISIVTKNKIKYVQYKGKDYKITKVKGGDL